MAVTHKYLVITCDYAARARGVTKLMDTTTARTKCVDIVLFKGEDLTPYRAASNAVRNRVCRSMDLRATSELHHHVAPVSGADPRP
mmetsp:Transcript_13971/g.37587  ORF Transcript_13971/g.37587 Transcript_13971/m.37587 type:complete len:86 (-) Transcript_13971:1311-1568(-)